MTGGEPYHLGACEALRMIDEGQLAPDAVLRSCLERIGAIEPSIGAFAALPSRFALPAGRTGALSGLPVGIKDIVETHDLPTGFGSPIYVGHRPPRDAFVVAAVRRAGGTLGGKTETTEFAGPRPARTCNPRDPAATPGGSSAGSAAAVAAGMLPLALGTQTAGSVIRPAAYCGVVGFKPSFGLIDLSGIRPVAASLDTVGVFARCVEDAGLLASVLVWDPTLALRPEQLFMPTIGLWLSQNLDLASAAAQAALGAAAALLGRAGMAVRNVAQPPFFDDVAASARLMLEAETARSTQFEAMQHPDKISAALQEVIGRGEAVTAGSLIAARQSLCKASAALDAAMAESGIDVLLTPAAPDEAPAGLLSTGDPVFNRDWTALHMPAITLPQVMGPRGLPIGLQLVGRRGQDARLLAAALGVETVLRAECGTPFLPD